MTLLRIRRTGAGVTGEEAPADAGLPPVSLNTARPIISRIAEMWDCELIPSQEMLIPPFQGKPGLLLLPEIILRRQGILIGEAQVEEAPATPGSSPNATRAATGTQGITFPPAASQELTLEREEDATTWEDFLLMKLAHTLASELKAELFYEDDPEPMLVEPQRFETFEHYVDKVLEFEDDLVKEMKRVWIYAHRKRAVR